MLVRCVVLLTACTFAVSSSAAAQGTKPAPKTAKPPAKSAPATKKPATPAPIAAPTPPPPPPPTDVRYTTKYTTGELVTDSATFITDHRERYELGDIILIKQRDQKRVVEISQSAKTYVIIPDDAPVAVPATPRPAGVVNVTVTITDLGERKDIFGQTARRVKTTIERLPDPGACDQSKVRAETDGWYIDMPKVMAANPEAAKPGTSGCADEIKATESGDPKLLGFAVSYRTTLTDLADKEAAPAESSMEVTEFAVLKLDAALFDIPAELTAAADTRAFTKAMSDANEARLAKGAAEAVAPAKKAGTLRVGVPEFANKAAQSVDTRALRSRIIRELEAQKVEAIPMAAGTPGELDARARELGVDYLLLAEITELKVSKTGRTDEDHEGRGERTDSRHHRSEAERATGAARRQAADEQEHRRQGRRRGIQDRAQAREAGRRRVHEVLHGRHDDGTDERPEPDADDEHRRHGQRRVDDDADGLRQLDRPHRRRGQLRHAAGDGGGGDWSIARTLVRRRAGRSDHRRWQGSCRDAEEGEEIGSVQFLQVRVPREGHEDVRENQQNDGLSDNGQGDS